MFSLKSRRTALLGKRSCAMLKSQMAGVCCRIIIMGLESLMSRVRRRCAFSKVESLSSNLRFLRGIGCLVVAKKIAVSWARSMKSCNGSWTLNRVNILSRPRDNLLVVGSHHGCRSCFLIQITWGLAPALGGGWVYVLGTSLAMVHCVYLNMIFFTDPRHACCSWEVLSHLYCAVLFSRVAEQLSRAWPIVAVSTHVKAGIVAIHAGVVVVPALIRIKARVAFLVKATVNLRSLLVALELSWISVHHA